MVSFLVGGQKLPRFPMAIPVFILALFLSSLLQARPLLVEELNILVWDLDASESNDPNLQKRLHQAENGLMELSAKQHIDLVLLTSLYQPLNYKFGNGRRIQAKWPGGSSEGAISNGLVWMGDLSVTRSPIPMAVQNDLKSTHFRGANLLKIAKGGYTIYLIVMSFSPEYQTMMHVNSEANAEKNALFLKKAVHWVEQVKVSDGLKNDAKAKVLVLTQHLSQTGGYRFANLSNIHDQLPVSFIHRFVSHKHEITEYKAHLEEEFYNFKPSVNRLAERVFRKFRKMHNSTMIQTLDLFVEEGLHTENSSLSTLPLKARHTWYWENPVDDSIEGMKMAIGMGMSKPMEKESFIKTGTEMKVISPYEPQLLRLKLNQ